MRRMLRIFKWLGLSLSTLLLAATVFLWVRSLGYVEEWIFIRFEPRPDWNAPELAGKGIQRWRYAAVIDGRLWLGAGTLAPEPEFEPRMQYRRDPISADEAKGHFDVMCQPGARPWAPGTDRAWRFAGMGFRHWRTTVDSLIGRTGNEAFHFALPFWMLAVVFALWPLLFVTVRLLRKKRYPKGHCPACGYDLRATPDPSGPRLPRCPECGREIAATTS